MNMHTKTAFIWYFPFFFLLFFWLFLEFPMPVVLRTYDTCIYVPDMMFLALLHELKVVLATLPGGSSYGSSSR